MVDWTMLSPTFIAAVIEWAGAVVTVLALGLAPATRNNQGSEQ